MLNIILKVLSAKANIINEATKFQNFCHTNHNNNQYRNSRENFYNYFYNNFSDDEIMVIQSIMYIGRDDVSTATLPKYNNIVDLVNIYFNELNLSLNKKIDKEIEIDQMVSKGMRIADYFNAGFQIVK